LKWISFLSSTAVGTLPPKEMNPVFLYIPNLIGYLRIILALLSLALLPTSPQRAIFLYFTSCLLDAADGYAARYFGQSSGFGGVLDMVTDRYVV
jgi:CDP-diacylglycerol--inositol 3-phosphatidyltransferase